MIITSLFCGLIPAPEKLRIASKPPLEYVIQNEEFMDLSDTYFLKINQETYSDLIAKSILQLTASTEVDKISSTVANQSLRVIENVFPSATEKLNLDNIYSTEYGTVIIEWEVSQNDLFSLEIGKQQMGYFVEKDGQHIKQVDSLSLDETNFLASLSTLLVDLGEHL